MIIQSLTELIGSPMNEESEIIASFSRRLKSIEEQNAFLRKQIKEIQDDYRFRHTMNKAAQIDIGNLFKLTHALTKRIEQLEQQVKNHERTN